MREIEYVSEDAVDASLEMERKLQLLPPHAGVIFVGVKAIPALGGLVTTYEVRVGIRKILSEQAGAALITHALKDWIAAGVHINAAVYLGVAGASHDGLDAQVGISPS